MFDLVGLVCAFEAIRIGGSAFHQTVGGASIPISCVLNVLITGKTYARGQLTGIAVVVAGLAIKARSLLEGDAPFPLDATAYCLAMCVGYALRGIAMEYLTKVKPNPPSGDRMTLQMGVSGFLAWCAYAAWFVAPRYRELVAEPFAAARGGTAARKPSRCTPPTRSPAASRASASSRSSRAGARPC